MSGGAGVDGAGAGTFEVRVVRDAGELATAAGAIYHYFGRQTPDAAWTDRWLRNFELARMHAGLEDGVVIGGAGAYSLGLTVPGLAVVPTAGVTIVGVLPHRRRRGLLRQLMRAQLDDIRERGEPLAALWASEETIYRRFGYGVATLSLALTIPGDRDAFHRDVAVVGDVRLLSPAEALEQLPAVYDRVRRAVPGMFDRSPDWWDLRIVDDPEDRRGGGGPKHFAALEVDGRLEAYAVYRIHAGFGGTGFSSRLEVIEALGATPAATASIWRFLLDVDWVDTISARLLSVDHPLPLLLERPRRSAPHLSDGLWLRLVDVEAALGARAFAGDGSVVLGVRDEACPWNAGGFAVSSGGVARTDAAPELELDVADLGSVYLGGFTFAQLAGAGRVEEAAPGAVARADALFRCAAAPWTPEIF
jgi:predicted acetyltransferase